MSKYLKQSGNMLERILSPQVINSTQGPRVTVLGTARSGKSSILGLLHIVLIDLANKGLLRYRVHEYQPFQYGKYTRVLGQRQSAAEMRSGKFPDPTPMGTTFEADMTIVWKNRWGKDREVSLPFIDLAGEEVSAMVADLNQGVYNIPQVMTTGQALHEKILQATGFILVVPTTRAIFGDFQFEQEYDSRLKHITDVKLAQIVERVYDYKKQHSADQKIAPIKAIAVILSKYDLVAPILLAQGIDLRTEDGRHKFLSNYFQETYSMLHFIGLEHVKIIPSWIDCLYEPVVNPDGHPQIDQKTQQPLMRTVMMPDQVYTDEDGKTVVIPGQPKIKVDFNPRTGTRLPSFPYENYLELIEWIRINFAA